jgi:hypothetical protein
MDDLWPDNLDKVEAANAPVIILREQAALLSRKMKNVIEGQVSRGTTDSVSLASDEFVYNFYITCTSLSYRYQPFYLAHNVDMYPSYLHMDRDIVAELNPQRMAGAIGPDFLTAGSEDELKEVLRKIFASQKVKKVIQALLGQLQTGYASSPQA